MSIQQTFLLFIILLGFAPVAYLNLGQLLCQLLQKIKFIKQLEKELPLSVTFFPGIILHSYFVFALRSMGMPWELTGLVTILLVIVPVSLTKSTISRLRDYTPSINFALWLFVILGIGISILDTTSNFETHWVNAYGDQAFHMGMLSSFTLGENLPPQNHLLPGETLSYPFIVNLWAASLWWPCSNLTALSLVFLFQWLSIWITVYHLFSGDKFKLLPWAIFFAGGSYGHLGAHSAQGIAANYPWSVFMSTIWVPQRSALLGLLGIATVLNRFHAYQREPSREFNLLWAGITAVFMPLAHTHMLLVVGLYVAFTIIFKFKRDCLKPLAIFGLTGALSLHAIYWLLGKERILKFSLGWYPWTNSSDFLDKLLGSAKMWFFNTGHIFIFVFIIVGLQLISKYRQSSAKTESVLPNFLAIFILFILGNFFQIAIWEWDQIKVFAPIYIAIISTFGLAAENPGLRRLQPLLALLMIPAIAETGMVFKENKKYGVYSQDDWTKAQAIIKETTSNDIILGSPDHNSLITLTGRRIFMGFPGTLYSHGSKYHDREAIMTSLTQAVNCSVQWSFKERKELCPTYLLWAHNEIRKWGVIDQKSALRLEPTKLSYLYKIK